MNTSARIAGSLATIMALGALLSWTEPAAAQQPSKTSDQGDTAQSPFGAAGGLITALGGALRGGHPVTTVDFHALKELLPASLPGMKRTNAIGETSETAGVKTASAKGDYQGGSATVHVEITDMSGVSGLMDLTNGMTQNTESESDTGYEKNAKIGGRTVHETYDSRAKTGQVSLILVRRYQVEVTGTGADMQTLEQSLGQIDLAKLESMKNAGAAPR